MAVTAYISRVFVVSRDIIKGGVVLNTLRFRLIASFLLISLLALAATSLIAVRIFKQELIRAA